MTSTRPEDAKQWDFFINPDKTASPIFEQLCLGLAQVIRTLEPNHDTDLSPGRLANFYRTVGGNYDELFFKTGEQGLSYIYRTLGCFHSLQPSKNPFESPNLPCLTDDGFVRWQTLQMLLCPYEHTAYLQRAVQVYNVPRPRGGGGGPTPFFPKHIPTGCFPAAPDAQMERWHKLVTAQMNQETHTRRIKFSPYQSPAPRWDTADGYFAQNPPRPSSSKQRRSVSKDADRERRMEAMRRRSSVPDALSPETAARTDRTELRKARSHSAKRAERDERWEDATRYASAGHSPSISRVSGGNPTRYSSGSRGNSASDTNSDDSYSLSQRQRRNKSSDEDNEKRKSQRGSSLLPSFFLSSNRRRHSSDGKIPALPHRDGRNPPSDTALQPDRRPRRNIDNPSNLRFHNPVSAMSDTGLHTATAHHRSDSQGRNHPAHGVAAFTHGPSNMQYTPYTPHTPQVDANPRVNVTTPNGTNEPASAAGWKGTRPTRVATKSGAQTRSYHPRDREK